MNYVSLASAHRVLRATGKLEALARLARIAPQEVSGREMPANSPGEFSESERNSKFGLRAGRSSARARGSKNRALSATRDSSSSAALI